MRKFIGGMSSTKIKSGIWAAGVAAIVAVGTLTGASMKEDSQKKEVSLVEEEEGDKKKRAGGRRGRRRGEELLETDNCTENQGI